MRRSILAGGAHAAALPLVAAVYYLVLKAAVRLGHHPLIYRLPSIVATVVAAALMGKVAGRLVGQAWLAGVAVLAFGLSASAVDVGLEVRAYALATCLTLPGSTTT